MPRIVVDYDSDSDFERNYLELATHDQILARYQQVKNSQTSSRKDKEDMLEHAVEKAFLALKRAEIKVEKANKEVAELKRRLELECNEPELKQQLGIEREKNANSEMKRELLAYEGVLPPYLDTKGTRWIMDRQMVWAKENKEMRAEKEAKQKIAAQAEKGLSLKEKAKRELARLEVENEKLKAHLQNNQQIFTMQNAMAPTHVIKLAEENMVLQAKWEVGWELSAERRAKKKAEEEAQREKERAKENQMQSETFADWRLRKRREQRKRERQGQRWRDLIEDEDEDYVEEKIVSQRAKGRPSS